jgi:ketosteroid isomerase-like protein
MSQENIDVIRRAFAVANAGDTEAMEPTAGERYHPDAEARDLQPAPGAPEVMRGREAIVAVWKQWLDALDHWRIEVHQFIDADPWVVCDVQWHATGKGSGISIDWRVAEAHRFRDGKIACSLFGFADVAAALEAIELSELDPHR